MNLPRNYVTLLQIFGGLGKKPDIPFRDAGLSDPDTKLMKADLAVTIFRELKQQDLNNIEASKLTGFQTGDISSIRNADPSRFTIDRLVAVLNRLGNRVAVIVTKRETEPAYSRLSKFLLARQDNEFLYESAREQNDNKKCSSSFGMSV